MEELQFPEPDRDRLLKKLKKLPITGRALRSRRNISCVSCRRSVLPLGRLAWPGAPLCRREGCEYTSLAKISEIFPTPYGRAIGAPIFRIFCKILERDRILVQRQPILKRAEALVDGYLDLLDWQLAYHTYDRLTNPKAYSQGRITLIPPRYLNDVLVFRAIEMPAAVDPTQTLPLDVHRMLHRVKKEGSSALAVPF
jgi:hypothetical protein